MARTENTLKVEYPDLVSQLESSRDKLSELIETLRRGVEVTISFKKTDEENVDSE